MFRVVCKAISLCGVVTERGRMAGTCALIIPDSRLGLSVSVRDFFRALVMLAQFADLEHSALKIRRCDRVRLAHAVTHPSVLRYFCQRPQSQRTWSPLRTFGAGTGEVSVKSGTVDPPF